jgi:predicted dehydrogenase
MDRRDFSKLAAFSLAATRLPLAAQTAAVQPVRYAAIGLGLISNIFLEACAKSQGSKVTALVTGHPDSKGVALAAKYGISKDSIYTYETFDRIRDNKQVDAVYIGLPNSMHCEFTERAAAAGKHVLCEKPMANTSAECRTMIDACHKASVKLMIAYRIHFEPLWNKATEMIRAGAIGQVQSFQGGFFSNLPAGAWRLDRKLAGGGPIFDLGIYPLNAIRHITGEEPAAFTAVTATRDQSGRFAQVEASMEWTMKLPSGIISSCSCSYDQVGAGSFVVHGDHGFLEFNPGFNYDGVHIYGETLHGPVDLVSTSRNPYQFMLEADYFSDCVRNSHMPEPSGDEGLKDLLAIEAIYRAAGAPIA